MEMMFHRDFRVRQSSSVLMYQLVKELENDVIKLQPKYISVETKQDILSSLFILKYDIIERVSTQASQIWKNIIDNQLLVLRQIIQVLIRQLFSIIQSEQLELQEMGLNCMRGIVEKFGEKIVSETLDILELYLQKSTKTSQNIGICKAIYNMTYAAPVKLLSDLRLRFLSIMDSNIANEVDEIRDLTAKVFITVFSKTYEPNFMTSVLDKQFLKKLHHYIVMQQNSEAELLIQTLKLMLKEGGGELKLEDKLIRLCNTTKPGEVHQAKLTIAQAKILAAVAPKIAQTMFKRKLTGQVLTVLMQELTEDDVDDETRVAEVLNTYSELMSQAPDSYIVTVNEQVITDFYLKCKDKGRERFYVDFIAYYCQHSKNNYERYAATYLENVMALMNDSDDKLVDKVVKSFSAVINGLQKEN